MHRWSFSCPCSPTIRQQLMGGPGSAVGRPAGPTWKLKVVEWAEDSASQGSHRRLRSWSQIADDCHEIAVQVGGSLRGTEANSDLLHLANSNAASCWGHLSITPCIAEGACRTPKASGNDGGTGNRAANACGLGMEWSVCSHASRKHTCLAASSNCCDVCDSSTPSDREGMNVNPFLVLYTVSHW